MLLLSLYLVSCFFDVFDEKRRLKILFMLTSYVHTSYSLSRQTAPKNEAFQALGDDILDFLRDEENVETLASYLTYHAINGEVLSTDLPPGMPDIDAETLQGQRIQVTHVDGQGIMVNDASVVPEFDLQSCNGVVHSINTVLMPPGCSGSIASTVADDEDLSILFELVGLVPGLAAALSDPDAPAITLFGKLLF